MKFKSNAKINKPMESGLIFDTKIGNIRFSIHHVMGCGEKWYMSCYELGFDQYSLESVSFNDAVHEGLQAIINKIDNIKHDIEAVKDEPIEIYRW